MRISFLISCLFVYLLPGAQQPFSKKVTESGIDLVYLPAGDFLMGSNEEDIARVVENCRKYSSSCGSEQFKHELPKRRVTINKGFWIGKYEVTQRQWQKIMGTAPGKTNCEGCPADNISWNDAQTFIEKLNALDDGMIYSLPTEAQWEFAARAGTNTLTAYGDRITGEQANFDGGYPLGSLVFITPKGKTTIVGQYPANNWGLHDMHGNVYEWCLDAYSPEGSSLPRDGSANKKVTGSNSFVLKGGSFIEWGLQMRSAYRRASPATTRSEHFGLRVVATENPLHKGGSAKPKNSNGQVIFSIVENGVTKWGVKSDSKIILPPIYKKIYDTEEGYQVLLPACSGLFDFSGNVLVPCKYWNIMLLEKDFYLAYDRKVSEADTTKFALFHGGKEILPPAVYKIIKPLPDGRIGVVKGDRTYYIDRDGNELPDEETSPTGKNDEIAKWTAHIKKNPNDPDGYLNRGILYYKANNFPSALTDFTKSIEVNPEYLVGSAYYYRANVYYKQAKYELALADMNRCIQQEAPFSRSLADRMAFRAQIYCRLGLKLAAAEEEAKVLELEGEITEPCK